MEGFFGYIFFNSFKFEAKEIYFFSPSEHTIAQNRMALEMQIKGFSDIQQITLILLFEEYDNLDNKQLEYFKFGKDFYK